ncbi:MULTISPECIES: hypothetical protein [unclassified Streptomyces]|uniref:hypothetical protein n=1 Tax=unclassified Streptomyces TaxID=2593676 RepID=UPI00225BCDF7|nr:MULTISPECIES: hypothetical protein [unclassified Streptomyces]MCX4527149.1 hypothetical protein [Streptomyces sp. NBC_01551]MCX4542275.1 hypothetical protein [Streptomyces sp. NBC_01565]
MSETLLSHAVGAVKRARRTAGRIRRRVERINTVPALGTRGRARPTLKPVHLSVLGGRTFNLAVPSPRRSADVASAFLVFERGTQRHVVAMELEPQPHGPTLLTATAGLRHARHDGPEASGPRLTDGVWRLTVEISDTNGRRARFGITAPTPHVADGPTLSAPPSPSSGAVFRPMRSVDGQSMIKVTGPRLGAELIAFDLRWDRVSVRGRLLAGGSPAEFTTEAVRRGGGMNPVTIPTEWDGDRFAFDVPLDAMAKGRAKGVWDIQMRSGRNRIKIGRRLSDVRHPKKVFRTPFRTIATEGGALLRVHAHLTAAGNLAVSSTVISTKETV